jgi:UDP-N-acetylmuramate dehydrogenase
MYRPEWFQELACIADDDLAVAANEDLSSKTSMRMGAVAAAYCQPDTPFALKKLLHQAKALGLPTFILGGGRNTLFATSYFDGVVINLDKRFGKLQAAGDMCIRAGASVQLPHLLSFAHRSGLMGLEFLTMVPGTVGGSLAGNAGAGNWGLCDFVERVWLMTRDGFIACVNRNQFRYTYRHSELSQAIVLEADFRLEHYDQHEAERRIEEYKAKKAGQPYRVPSSGCIFKNPRLPNGQSVSAGKLIDECGLKNYKIGSACVSQGHANFIVNEGASSGEDFLALISFIQDNVYAKTGIELETEVQIVGGPLNSAILS